MKKSILFLILSVFLFSCQKEELTPNNNNNQPIVVPPYTGPTTTPQTVVGHTWVITQYRVGQYGTILPLNDTLTFDNNTNYYYNSFKKYFSSLFKKGMNNFELITSLRNNIPVKLAFNNQERIENVVGRVSSQIEADSVSLIKIFKDSTFLKENGFTEENVLSICIPNTYEFYWNTKADKFRDKMIKEYRKFWNTERTSQAQKLGLTPVQVMTLASIVHKETVKKDERPRVAGVYLNRLRL